MATAAALRPEDIKALEQTRQRLYQLANNIGSLKTEIHRSSPLPEWSSLQRSTSILSNNVQSLTEHLSAHADLLSRTVVYPATNYPGRTQEGLLGQILRKKLEPRVEGWVEEGRRTQQEAEEQYKKNGSEINQLDELWSQAQDWIDHRIIDYVRNESGDNYTAEEREDGIENVRTGLRRKLEEDDSDDDDDDDEEMHDRDATVGVTTVMRDSTGNVEFGLGELKKNPASKCRTMEDILRFATSGVILDQTNVMR